MRYLRQQDHDEVKKLRIDGGLIKDIAKRFNVCEATISSIINGRYGVRKMKSVGGKIRNPFDPIDFKEEDFSQLPDNVLFEPVKERDFIG